MASPVVLDIIGSQSMLPESSRVKNTLGSTMVDRNRGAVGRFPGAACALCNDITVIAAANSDRESFTFDKLIMRILLILELFSII